jgi:hypothetical protein
MEFVYEEIVLTSIDVVDSPTPSSPNRVIFSAATPGKKDDTTATFIRKVKYVQKSPTETKAKSSHVMLEAEKILPGQVRSLINAESEEAAERSTDAKDMDVNRKVLFTVHGYDQDPIEYLLEIKGVETRFKKFKLIPVLWPSSSDSVGMFVYPRDKILGQGAAKAFQSIVEPAESFSKSILAHSMGNYVLRKFANSSFNFDNIFMVAADVNHDLFNERYIEGGKQEWRKDGLRIKDMLTEGKDGKIHVVYNKRDTTLMKSSFLNRDSRLGRSGIPLGGDCLLRKADKVHEDIKDVVTTIDWTRSYPSDSHSYQFDLGIVGYYESQY